MGKMRKHRFVVATAVAAVVLSGVAVANEKHINLEAPEFKDYVVGDKYSDYVVSNRETREMQDDDFSNPGFLWVEQGESLWSTKDGTEDKSCADCHDGIESMKGVSTTYPKYYESVGKLQTVEHIINRCRTERMGAEAWKWESDPMLGMSALIRMQSRGMPVNVAIDGEAAPYFEKGKEFYFQRRGQLDLACAHCHVDHPGEKVRSELLGQGMPNGFPTYRLKWQKLGSLHRRFKGCNDQIRAEPYGRGSEEYTNLELYVMWRANGLAVESPAVRR
ncbi:MAG: sulfur oxidation c-type cytochrome SoxA [Magnetospiraceae bacterium]